MALAIDAPVPIIIGNDHQVMLRNVVDRDGALIDMTPANGWNEPVRWFLREKPHSTDHLLMKEGTLVGTFDADPDVNSQAWIAELSDTETELLAENRNRYYSWKRMDPGAETDLAHGKQQVLRTASR